MPNIEKVVNFGRTPSWQKLVASFADLYVKCLEDYEREGRWRHPSAFKVKINRSHLGDILLLWLRDSSTSIRTS